MQEAILKEKTAFNSHIKPTRSQSTLIDLSNHFTSLKRPSNKDISLFREQFYILILNTSRLERKQIANALAYSEYTPKPIIIYFAMEEIAVASQPLLYSPVLQPSDINLIIDKCSPEHAKVIARRKNLDVSNIKALLAMDDTSQEIKNILNKNMALLDNSEMIETLSNSKASDQWITQPAKTITNQITEITKPKVSNASKDLSTSLLKLANRGGKLTRKPIGESEKSAFNAITLKQIETQLLATSRYIDMEAFATSIQYFCGLNYQVAFDLLRKQDAGMLATLLRALEITEVTAARILLMMNHDIGRNAQIFKVVMNKYRNLDRPECISFFTKLGADFTRSHFNEVSNKPATRYALSLAARERRASLLQQENFGADNYHDKKLIA